MSLLDLKKKKKKKLIIPLTLTHIKRTFQVAGDGFM